MPLFVKPVTPRRRVEELRPLDRIEAEVSKVDDVPVFTRTRTFVVAQGVSTTIDHTFRDRRGNAIDLSTYLASDGSEEA